MGENASPGCNSSVVATKQEIGWQLWSQVVQKMTANAQSY